MNEMIELGQPNRDLYKSIVIGMSICLTVGIGIGIGIGVGIVHNQIPFGILAGNTAGILLGLVISKLNRN